MTRSSHSEIRSKSVLSCPRSLKRLELEFEIVNVLKNKWCIDFKILREKIGAKILKAEIENLIFLRQVHTPIPTDRVGGSVGSLKSTIGRE